MNRPYIFYGFFWNWAILATLDYVVNDVAETNVPHVLQQILCLERVMKAILRSNGDKWPVYWSPLIFPSLLREPMLLSFGLLLTPLLSDLSFGTFLTIFRGVGWAKHVDILKSRESLLSSLINAIHAGSFGANEARILSLVKFWNRSPTKPDYPAFMMENDWFWTEFG